MAHLNAAGITRLVTKLKDRFAALAHTHAAATDITGQLPVANGGTGASTASGARTNLDAAQDNSSGITLADAASNISTLLATTGIASTPSGKTLQGQISTLQDSVSSDTTGISITDNSPYTASNVNVKRFGKLAIITCTIKSSQARSVTYSEMLCKINGGVAGGVAVSDYLCGAVNSIGNTWITVTSAISANASFGVTFLLFLA